MRSNVHRPRILPPFFYANYGPIVMMVNPIETMMV